MPLMNIKILDGVNEKPPYEGENRPIIHLRDVPLDVLLLNGGMKTGEPSVAFSVVLPNGTRLVIENSFSNWEMANAAMTGATRRWGVR